MGNDLYHDAMARLEAGDVDEGRRLLEEALRRAPDSVEVMHGLGRALELSGERTRALELFERANTRDPSAPAPACDLAMLYMEREENDRAERVLLPVLRADPAHSRANLYMGLALMKTEPSRARTYVDKVLEDSDPEIRSQAVALDRALAGF